MKNSNSVAITSSEGTDSLAPRMLLESASSNTNGLSSAARFWLCTEEDYILDACEDEYGGIIVNPEKLPWNINAFAYALQASILSWKQKVHVRKKSSFKTLDHSSYLALKLCPQTLLASSIKAVSDLVAFRAFG